jgi:hypothetical protein
MKPQLTASKLSTLSFCGILFQRLYGSEFGVWPIKERRPPGIAALTGTAVHA